MPNQVNQLSSNIQTNHQIIPFSKDRYLLTGKGEILKSYPYSSQFSQELSEKLMDPGRAEAIANALDKHIAKAALPLYNGANILHEWREALKYYANLLGQDGKEMLETFKKHAHVEVRKFIEAYPVESQKFFNEIAEREGRLNMGLDKPSKKVVVLTSSSGGGHVTAANAIRELMKTRGFEAIVLNQDELDKENDPLTFAGVKYKGEEITMADVYNRVFQQDNDLSAANTLWGIGNEVRSFKPNRQMETLAKKVREINPAMIFSVATHHPEHASLANITGKKLKYVHTDYDFNNALLSIADKVNPERINFWVNADDPEILQGKKLGGWDVPLDHLKESGVIQSAGYPVRPSFVRETDPEKIAKIKEEKGISKNSKVVLLSMGRQGIRDHILKYMKLLHDPKNHLEGPVHLVIVCGKNEKLKTELEEYIKTLPESEKHPLVDFKVEGFVEEKEMADYYKISNALISKPGGATAAECAAMGLPMLSVDPHPWELPNQSYLERHGLAERLESEETFLSQLKSLFAKSEMSGEFQPVDWKSEMASLVDKELPAKKEQPAVMQQDWIAFLQLLKKLDLLSSHWINRPSGQKPMFDLSKHSLMPLVAAQA